MRPELLLGYEGRKIVPYSSEHLQLSLKPAAATQDLSLDEAFTHSEGNSPGIFNKVYFSVLTLLLCY